MSLILAALLALAADTAPATSPALAPLDAIYPDLDALCRDLHANPELSLQEEKTSATLAERFRRLGYEVTEKVGGFGVVAVMKNGKDPTVLLRADMDALPVEEKTGLPYASRVTIKDSSGATVPVMHACGHDVHMTSLVGAATLLARARERWRGSLVLVAQPAEETGDGAFVESGAATYNDPALSKRVASALAAVLGKDRVIETPPVMGGEDFGEFGKAANAPSFLFWVGGVPAAKWAEVKGDATKLPSLHSALWAPDPEPTLKAGAAALTLAALELLGKLGISLSRCPNGVPTYRGTARTRGRACRCDDAFPVAGLGDLASRLGYRSEAAFSRASSASSASRQARFRRNGDAGSAGRLLLAGDGLTSR